jgi:hypothetical protein
MSQHLNEIKEDTRKVINEIRKTTQDVEGDLNEDLASFKKKKQKSKKSKGNPGIKSSLKVKNPVENHRRLKEVEDRISGLKDQVDIMNKIDDYIKK